MWSARDRTIIAKTKQYLEGSTSLKVEIEELESLLGLDDTDVDFRVILDEARDGKGCATCETFSSEGPSEILTKWQQCNNKILVAREGKPLTKWQWYEVVETKAHRGRLWRMLAKDQYIREMWEYYSCERSNVKKEVSRGCRDGKAGRDTRPLAARIAGQGILGTSDVL